MTTPATSAAKERIAYITLVGLVAYAAVATDLYLPAIPEMALAFAATESEAQVTLTLFMFGMAGGQLVFGPLSDYYGRIPVVVTGTLLFILTSVACAFASSMELLWTARLLQGVAAASGPVIARAIVRDRYQGNRAAQVMSALGAAMAVIPLFAPTIGAWVVIWFDWRATFIALAIFGGMVLWGIRQLDESAPAIRQGDLGILRILGLFSTCLSHPQFIGYQITGTLSYGVILAYLSTVSFIMRDVFELPTSLFGYAFAISVSGFMAGALVCSRIVVRIGLNPTLTLGLTLLLLSSLVQWWLSLAAAPGPVGLGITSFLVFLGIGLTAPNSSMGAVSIFPQFAGAASAVYGTLHATTAGVVGFLAGFLYDGTLVPTATIMLVCAIGALAGLPLARGQRPTDSLSTSERDAS